MIEAKEILFVVLAFCALWITAFIAWFLFQVATVIKNINAILHEVKYQFERVDQTLNAIKTKFHEGSLHLNKLADDVKSYVSSNTKEKK